MHPLEVDPAGEFHEALRTSGCPPEGSDIAKTPERKSSNSAFHKRIKSAANTDVPRKARLAILACVGAYWLLSVLYVTPNNYIKAKGIALMDLFQLVFFQRWDFFAPPSTANYRIYIETLANDGQTPASYELAQPLMEAKRRKAPFNSAETAIDYQLSNSLLKIEIALADAIQDFRRKDPSITDADAGQKAVAFVASGASDAASDVQLVRLYCEQAAARYFSSPQRQRYIIRIARSAVPPFREFVASQPVSSPPSETLIFEIPNQP